MKEYKKMLEIIVVTMFVGAGLIFAGCGRSGDHSAVSQNKITYRCPMHPAYTSDKPGDCSICGMKLVKAENNSRDKSSAQEMNAPALSKEKTLKEVCLTYKCTVKNCPMDIKVHLKPGERLICPVCGEVIVTTSGKVVEIPNERLSQAPASAAIKKERKLLYYRNSMNPQATSPVPMKDSMGMDYIPVYEEDTSTAPGTGTKVTISPERQQMIGVTTEAVQIRDLTKGVGVFGKIAYDPEVAVKQEEVI
jgi:hypothetical protein